MSEIELHVERVVAHRLIAPENFTEVEYERLCGQALMRATLSASIYKTPPEVLEARHPTTWWDAFKERWFPRWLLRRFPSHWTVIRLERGAYYPTIPHRKVEHVPIPFLHESSWGDR